MPARLLVLAGALAALAACGSSAAQKQVDQAESACLALPGNGGTLASAAALFGAARTGLICDPQPAPLAGGTCAPTAGNPECQVFFELFTPDYCGPQGCCHLCEVRVLQQSTVPSPGDAPVCAAKFYRKQPCQ